MNVNTGVTLVEEIIRDGSYVVDFKLNREDLYRLALMIDDLEVVGLIDVGPGTGFGTSSPEPILSDREHLDVVTDAVEHTGLTAFLLTGVATEREVELLAEYSDNFDLIRVGVDVDSVAEAEDLLSWTADLDISVSLNLLKIYLSPPEEAVHAAGFGVDIGADGVYVVDSAGGLRPNEVTDYVGLIRDNLDVDVGFHGHDNIGTGLQNTVAAMECGATYIDSSIKGIGRSAGNVATEHVLGYLAEEDNGWEPDWVHVEQIEDTLSEIYPDEGRIAAKDVLYGRAKLHSSNEAELTALAADHGDSLIDLLEYAMRHDLSTMERVRNEYPTADAPYR